MACFDIALLVPRRLLGDTLAQLLTLNGHRVVQSAMSRDALFSGLQAQRPAIVVVDLDRTEDSLEPAGESETLSLLKSLAAWYPEARVLVLADRPSGKLIDEVNEGGAHGLIDKNEALFAHLLQALEAVSTGNRFFPVDSLQPVPAPSEEHPAAPRRFGTLTHREVEVLRYIAAGADNLHIATCLQVSERTVRAHVSALYRKLAAGNRVSLALHAGRLGLRSQSL